MCICIVYDDIPTFQGIMMKIEHMSEPKEFVVCKESEFARVGRKGKSVHHVGQNIPGFCCDPSFRGCNYNILVGIWALREAWQKQNGFEEMLDIFAYRYLLKGQCHENFIWTETVGV